MGPEVAGAKKLLAEAGFAGGMPIELFIPGSEPAMERLATTFRDTAKQAGITVSLRIVPQDKFFAEMEGKVPFNVDQFYGRTTPDLMLYAWYHSTGSWNSTLALQQSGGRQDPRCSARHRRQGGAGKAVWSVPGDRCQGRARFCRLRAELRLRRQQEGGRIRWRAADVG